MPTNPFQNVFNQCMDLKPNESVLIVTDPARRVLAGKFLKVAKTITQKAELISFDTMTENAQEPPKEVADKMKQSDVALLITTFSLSHTQARKNACLNGCRIASMPGITQDIVTRTLAYDYTKIAKITQKLANILSKGKKITITAKKGTDLSLDISKRKAIADTGLFTKPGSFGNLPAGEAFIAPIETKTNGLVVFDGAMADISLDQPITLEINNGIAEKITGGKAAKKLNQLVDRVGLKARLIGELGIGTNPTVKLCPNMLEAEKLYGTCHLALGNNATFGGTNLVPFHSDGIILNPLITLDGKIIVKNNKIIL